MSLIHDQIKEYISENILFSSGYPYPDDASFLEEGIIDSMNVMELVNYVEQHFDLDVEDHEIIPDYFDSINKIADYIQQKKN